MSVDSSGRITYQMVEKYGTVDFDRVPHKDSYGSLVQEDGEPIPSP
jgi:hypothetical protein